MHDQISNKDTARLGKGGSEKSTKDTKDAGDAIVPGRVSPVSQLELVYLDLPFDQFGAIFPNDHCEMQTSMLSGSAVRMLSGKHRLTWTISISSVLCNIERTAAVTVATSSASMPDPLDRRRELDSCIASAGR